MNGQFGLIFQSFSGAAFFVAGVWLLCVKLPAEWRRRKRMLVAVGVIQSGMSLPGAQGAGTRISLVAPGPLVAFRTDDGADVITTLGVIRHGRGSKVSRYDSGQDVLLKYDPADPKVVCLDGQPSRIAFYGMFCASLLICGGLMAVMSLRDLVASQ